MEGPERIGRYRVTEVIGAGGFATVYKAHDERLDATVAVKVLAENHCLDPDVRERFLQEGRILRHIGSPHVVTVHDLGETERGQPYLVLDHAERGDLSSRVADRRAAGWTPSRDDVLAVAEALANALAAVHAADVVHRDLAPRNLLLRADRTPGTGSATGIIDADERLLLADLGLSKDLATASGLTVGAGTAGFSPPEQQAGPGTVDARADLWAATAVLVWLLLGRPPIEAGVWRSDLSAAGWPDALGTALSTGMANDPRDRPEHAAAWLDTIRSALAPPPPPPAPAPPPPVTVPTTSRRSLGWTAAVLAGAVAFGLIVGWLAARELDDDGGPTSELTAVDDDRVRADARSGDREVSITGPRNVTVGDVATFEMTSSGVERWIWIGPDGGVHADVGQLDVETASTGRASVRLIGVDGHGRTTEAVLDFRVIEE